MLALILCITIGYATLTTTLNITGNSEIKNAKWDIHFANLVVDDISVEATTPATIDSNKTTVNYAVNLVKPGDSYSFKVDVVNEGTIDGMINTVTNAGLTEEQQKYVDYSITYDDGAELKAKDGLQAGAKRNIKVKVKYKDDINPGDLPKANETLNLTFTVEYVQADDSSSTEVDSTVCKANKNITVESGTVCKRAEKLHTEECTQTDSSMYCSGVGYTASGSKGTTTIMYGECGTKGALNSGDAFDCDVNNDGTYDPVTERFYYVSPAYEDGTYSDSYVTLIYYNNTTNGLPDNTTASLIAYDSSNENYHGPRTGYVNLPSISQWSNPNLKTNMTRQMRAETGTINTYYGEESFTYTGKAARLLTSQEVEKACGITIGSPRPGELDNCSFLVENTKYSSESLGNYGYWLESPQESIWSNVWGVLGNYRLVANNAANNASGIGIRPTITVLKSNISY